MCSSIPGCGGDSIALVAMFLGGLLLSSVVGDLPLSDGELPKAIAKTSNEQQLPVPEPLLNTEPPSPYEMVAHSDYNNRLLVQLKAPSKGEQKQVHGGTPAFVTTLLPTVPTQKRSSNDIPRRTRYSPAPITTEEDPHRTLLTPGRYYDSYGEWHHGGDDSTQHWPTHPHVTTQLYYNHGNTGNWDWKPHPHHHHHQQQQQQHHGNVLAEILDSTALYPPYLHQQQHGLLGLQLFILLHPVLMLGTVSFLVCLINAVLGLVDKVKLPLVRAQDVDRISAGTSTPPGLRDGRDEHMLDQLHQFLHAAIDHQQHQQRNDTFVQGRS